MKRSSLARFFVLMFLEVVAANMVHPVTPTFLTQLQMPEFMFGAAFAAMSLTNFLFCPFWGAVGDRVGRVRTLFITILGYAAGQILFLFGSTISADPFGPDGRGRFQRRRDRVLYGICGRHRRTGTLRPGHGGVRRPHLRGDRHRLPGRGRFGGPVRSSQLLGAVRDPLRHRPGGFAALADGEHYVSKEVSFAQALNPLSVFSRGKGHFTKPMLVFLAGVFLACFASTAYDNAFNYFLKDQFSFPLLQRLHLRSHWGGGHHL